MWPATASLGPIVSDRVLSDYYYYWHFRARRPICHSAPIGTFISLSCHKHITALYITVTDNLRQWGGPRDRAAMGLEPTTPHRVLHGAAGASALTTRPSESRPSGGVA